MCVCVLGGGGGGGGGDKEHVLIEFRKSGAYIKRYGADLKKCVTFS